MVSGVCRCLGLVAGRRLPAPVSVTLTDPLAESDQHESRIARIAQLGTERVERRQFQMTV